MRTLYTADFVVTMDAGNTVVPDGGVLVEDDRIAAVGSRAELLAASAPPDGPPGPVRHLPGRLLMPGLINTHTHSGLLRGTAEQLPVWEWLRVHIDPMHRVLRPAEAEAASWLCYAESLLSGTTTVVDMWRFMDGAARAATQLGNRLVTVNYTGAHPDYDYLDTLDDNERMLARWHGEAGGRISVWVGLEHPFYADAAGLRRAIAMARGHDTGLYTHCSESSIEPPEFERRYGQRPMFALESLGFFTAPRAMIAHGVWLDRAEIALLATHDVSVAHNPVSNMKLASGMAPVEEYLAAGVAVGLGTDGEKENNNLDMFEEMKAASLLAKLRAMDAAALDSWQVLRMATIGGARALRLAAEIGSLEPGKKADFIAVRTDTPRMTPIFGSGPTPTCTTTWCTRSAAATLTSWSSTEWWWPRPAAWPTPTSPSSSTGPGPWCPACSSGAPPIWPSTGSRRRCCSDGRSRRPGRLVPDRRRRRRPRGESSRADHPAARAPGQRRVRRRAGAGHRRGPRRASRARAAGHRAVRARLDDAGPPARCPVRCGALFDVVPEAHEPGRRYVRCGWVTLRTSAPRIVENFLDMAHFPFVHTGVLGSEPWTEVLDYDTEIRADVDELWATNCTFFQPQVAVTESAGAYAALTFRVPSPFQVMLYRVCPSAPERLDAIMLAVHPIEEHLCRAQPLLYLVDAESTDNDLRGFEQAIFLQDRFIVENQRPLSLPIAPGTEIPVRADAASMAYRRWLREKNLTFGVLGYLTGCSAVLWDAARPDRPDTQGF